MTPEHEIDAVYQLIAKRQRLTFINMIGIVVILAGQFVLSKYVLMDYMIYYPLVIMVWGIIFVILIIKMTIKINKACKALSDQIRERQNVREPRQDSGDQNGYGRKAQKPLD